MPMTRDVRGQDADLPRRFGKYQLVDRLAVGGMAEIYRAKTKGIGGFEKILAIKKLHDNLSQDDDFIEMMVDEAKIAVRLTHPNIAKIFDLGRLETHYYIAMEYIEGPDLSGLLKAAADEGERLPIPAVLFVGAECCSALHYAHTRHDAEGRPMRIVHRDVSPPNIMLSVEGEVKIVDFGIAKARQRAQQTHQGVIKGKFKYMAPEQAEGGRVDGRTDVFATGVVLYEMITGVNPYDHYAKERLIEEVRRADIPSMRQHRPSLDPELDELVMRAVRRDPDQRYPSAAELERAMTDYRDRKCEPYDRRRLAQLVRRYWRSRGDIHSAAPGGEMASSPAPSGEDPSATEGEQMTTSDYEAAESSLLYEMEENPFSDDEPTQVWDGSGEDRQEAETRDVQSPAGVLDEVDQQASAADGGAGSTGGEASTGRGIVDERSLPPMPDADEIVSGDEQVGRQEEKTARATSSEPTERTYRARAYGLLGDFVDSLERVGIDRQTQAYGAVALGSIIVAGMGLGAFAIWAANGSSGPPERIEKEPTEATTAAVSGRDQPTTVDVPVETDPTGVRVKLDGKLQGKSPLDLEGLEVGKTYELTFEKAGYKRDVREISPSAKFEPISVSLLEADGILQVETQPSGAVVEVDGEKIGESPVTVEHLARGREHQVVVRHEDAEQRETVAWEKGGDDFKEVSLTIERAAEESDPHRGASQRRVRRGEPAGRRRTQKAVASESTTSEASAAPETSSDHSSSTKSADLFASGSSGGEANGTGGSASSSGGESETTNLDIWGMGKGGGGNTEEAGEGYLSVQVKKGWGKVYVGDEMVTSETPLVKHALEPGSYTVKVYYPVLKRFSGERTVTIEAGEQTRAIFDP